MTTEGLSILDSRTYLMLHRASQALLLGLLWTIVALPVLTAVPATAALTAVIRERQANPECPLVRHFFGHLRAQWRETALLGIAFTSAAAIVAYNVMIASQLAGLLGPILMAAAAPPSVLALGVTFNYIVHLVHYESTRHRRVRIALILTVGRPATTVTYAAVAAAVALGTYWFPALPILCATTVAATLLRAGSRGLAGLTTARPLGGTE